MKKLIAILAILMLVPFTAFGLESLSEDALDNVTGQAGVSINANINIASVHMDTLAWGDSDGVVGSGSTSTGSGWVGLSNFNMTNIQLHPRTDWVYGTDAEKALLQFITIDVATDPAGATGKYNGATYVHINPGSIEVIVGSMTTDVALGANAATGLTQVLGNVGMTNLLVRLGQDNFIDIYSGQSLQGAALGFAATGVTMTFRFNLDSITMDTLTWGDADGVTDGPVVTTGGVVGLRNFVIDDMIVTGTVTIDVATIGTGAALTAPSDMSTAAGRAANWGNIVYIYALLNQTSDTFVHIGLNNINVTIARMTTDVVVGATVATATGATNTLGSIYASNIQVNGINGFVDIFAH